MNKVDCFNNMLHTGRTFLVVCDPRYASTLVPESLSKQPDLGIGLNMYVPIPGSIEAKDTGFLATLRFSGRPFDCFVSWESIKSMSYADDNMGYQWHVVEPPQKVEKPKARGHLKLVVNNG